MLKSPTGSVTLTKTYSKSSDNYSDNSLLGTDYRIPNPGNAYVLSYKQTYGIGFYRLSATGKITPNKAYLIIPITYLTQWKIVGNSEVHDNEIWSCGEYNATDGKYHIFIQPQGGSIVDIALTEPLRKVNNVADTIEFPSETEGKALVTRNIAELSVAGNVLSYRNTNREDEWRWNLRGSAKGTDYQTIGNIVCSNYNSLPSLQTFARNTGIGIESNGVIVLFDKTYNQQTDKEALEAANANTKYIFELASPTTELVDAPQIEEAESYTCVTIPGSKALSWSEFIYTLNYPLTDSENNLLVDSENYQLTVQS